MQNDYKKLMDLLHPVPLSRWLMNELGNLLLFGLSVVLNVFLGSLFGALIGWVLGGWISTTLALFGMHTPGGEVYRLTSTLGLTTGFLATFFKSTPTLTRIKR